MSTGHRMVASQCKLNTCSKMNTEYRSHDGSQSAC